MSTNTLVGWVMAGNPSYPVLLYAGNRDTTKILDEEAQRVREVSEGIAKRCGIYHTVHVGTYLAYLSILGNCLIERAGPPETEKTASTS